MEAREDSRNWLEDQKFQPFCTNVSFDAEETFWNNFPNPRVKVLYEFSGTELVVKEYPMLVAIEDGCDNMIVMAENDGDRVTVADRLFSHLASVRGDIHDAGRIDMIEKIIYKMYVGDLQLIMN